MREHAKSITYTVVQLMEHRKRFIERAKQGRTLTFDTLKPEHFTAGEHCHFCKGRPVCSAHFEMHTKGVIEMENLPDSPFILTDEQVSKLIEKGDEIKKIVDSAKKYALERYKDGNPIPGTKGVRLRGGRTWTDEEKTVEELQGMGVDPYDKKLKPFTRVEKEIGRGKVNHLLTHVPGKLAVVSEHDPRPAIGTDLFEIEE